MSIETKYRRRIEGRTTPSLPQRITTNFDAPRKLSGETTLKSESQQSAFQRHPNRIPVPDLDTLLRESNDILSRVDRPRITSFAPVEDLDSASPTVIGLVDDAPTYVVKAIFGHPETLAEQVEAANWVREHRDLPVPEHYGYATDPDRLPLVVLEWLPGRQLRLAVTESSDEIRIPICRDWGRCTARINVTRGFPDHLIDHDASKENWGVNDEHFQMSLDRAAQLEEAAGWSRSRCDAMKAYITNRREAFVASQHRGLTKRDIYERDFLATTTGTPAVSGVLDWERVNLGYTPANSIDNYMRLHQRNLGHLWAPYCAGYEQEAAHPFVQDEAAEYYSAVRFLIAAARSVPYTAGLLEAMLDGKRLPFERRE